MYKCVVCRNTSSKTKYTRPDVIYHTFPKNEYRRRKWLKIYGIGRCYEWHRICSDHFLDKNYRPGLKRFLNKNTIPQPYNKNNEENGFPSNYTNITQSNDVEMDNDEFLPTEQHHLIYTTLNNDVEMSTNEFLPREQSCLSYTTQSIDVETGTNEFLPREQTCLSYTTQSTDVETSTNDFLPREQNSLREIQNAVIKNFQSPRRSCRKIKLTTTNEDMSYENMPRLQTERFERHVPTLTANENIQTVSDRVVVPVLTTTKDYTLGNGPLCSVKNCLNRFSKDLSFFGYPKDFTLRKKWIELCGLQVDPTEKLKSNAKVCRAHFDNDCFMNTKRKRLKSDALPSLFLDNDVIDARNIPSTSSAVNSGFIRVNKPSPIKSGTCRSNKRSPVNNLFIRANKPSCSSTNYVANINSVENKLLVYIEAITRSAKDFTTDCCIPGCITNNNTIEEVDDISLFVPPPERVNQWSSSLGLDLTTNSIVCERHFKPEDIRHPNLLVDNADKQLKSLAEHALPIPVMNAVPASRTYCIMPKCTTNTFEKVEDISFFTPQNEEEVTEWGLSVGLDLTIDSIVCEKHFRPCDIVVLSNGVKSLAPFAVPVAVLSLVDKSDNPPCCISRCITNSKLREKEDISLFTPKPEMVNKWSSILGMQLTDTSMVCQRHFRPHDMLQHLILGENDGIYKKVIVLVDDSLPLPMNDGLSASNATSCIQQLENNDVPVLRTYDDVKSKRHKPDELLCTKTINNNVLDKSLSTTDKMFPSKNKNKEFTAVTNDTRESNTTPDLDPTLKSNTVNSVDLSIVKIELLDDDLQTNFETEPEQLLPALGTELVEDDDLLPLSSIDDSLSTSLKKLKNISAHSSLSVTLEPIENSKITEPSVDLLSKEYPRSSISITLRPKHNLSSTTNNSSPSVSLPYCLPSTSNGSVYNISQQNLQYKQKATSTLNMPDKLSSNTVEIKMPVFSHYNSLAEQSDTHDSNPCIVIDDDDTEDFIQKDNGFIYEISKSVVLPAVFWKTDHDRSRNSTVFFYEGNNLYETVKNISFVNSLLPKIQINGKKYKYNNPVRSKNELQNLLEKIDRFRKCYGFDSIIHDNCIGYYDPTTEYVTSCSACQEKFQELHKMKESNTKFTENLQQKFSEQTAKVIELRENMENMENNKIIPVTIQPFSLINSMRVCRR